MMGTLVAVMRILWFVLQGCNKDNVGDTIIAVILLNRLTRGAKGQAPGFYLTTHLRF